MFGPPASGSTIGPAAPGPAYSVGPPTVSLEGTIQPPPPQWDPYGCPGAPAPTLLPQDPYLQGTPGYGVGTTFATMQKFIKEVRLDYVWMPSGGGVKDFGINDVGLSGTFAFPFLYNTQTPLLITPGFAFHLWSGPQSGLWLNFPGGSIWVDPLELPVGLRPFVSTPDMPAVAYDAYLDAAWNPQPTEWLGGELSFRIGVYSDFTKVVARSIRYTGTGLVVLNFSPSFKIKAGVWYLDRNQVKLLPAGGFVWSPNKDVVFEVLFPNPRVARRLATVGCTDWWVYLRGEYGGGAWTVRRADSANPAIADGIDFVDYDDMRVALGLEFKRPGGFTGLFEGGVAFERQLQYASQLPGVFYLNISFFLRAGLAF